MNYFAKEDVNTQKKKTAFGLPKRRESLDIIRLIFMSTETRWQRGLPQGLDPVQEWLRLPLTRRHHRVLARQREDTSADCHHDHPDHPEDRAC